MRKSILITSVLLSATLLVVLMFSAVIVVQFVSLAAANWYVWYPQTPNRDPPMLRIESPQSNSIYENNVTLKFTVTKPDSWAFEKSQFPVGNIAYIGYILDGQENSLFEGPTNPGEREYLDKITHYSVTHTLSDGPHCLVVEVSAKTWYLDGTEPARCYNAHSISLNVSDMIHFTVDTPPKILILSPEEKNYNTTEIPLNFTVDQSVSQITYNLDEQGNVIIAGNTTLTGLADGTHNIVVYAKDIADNIGASQTTYFSVAKKTEPLPINWIVAAIVIIVIGAAVFLVYFTKVKKTTGKAPK
jgi:hypothetical protein